MKKMHVLLRKTPLLSDLYSHWKLNNRNGFLTKTGWLKSFKYLRPQDRDGNPIPWYTYSIIQFLNTRDMKNLVVFEYGSGNSTHWWSNKVKKVYACEHDLEWSKEVKKDLPKNATFIFKDLEDGYSSSASMAKEKIDILVIDGRERVACAKNSLKHLSKNGVIIWDNTDREKYSEGYKFLLDKGYKQLDFLGLAPGNSSVCMTSVFYKKGNCLGI